MTDAKTLKQAQTAFQSLCQMLDEEKWHYTKDEENLKISCGARGDDLPIHVNIRVDADRSLVILLSQMPFSVPADKRADLAIAISRANFGMVDGNFDFDYRDGEILFRMTSSFLDSLLGKEMFRHMLYGSCSIVDHYNDKFLMVAKGNMTKEEIIAFID